MADKSKPVSNGTEKNISSIVRQYSGGEQPANVPQHLSTAPTRVSAARLPNV